MGTEPKEDDRRGRYLLARDLTAEELEAAPVLRTTDALIIEGLTSEEYDAFLVALAD